MNESSQRMNLNHRTDETVETNQQSVQGAGVLEFQSAEEMLRHDAATVEVPVGVAERLAESASSKPAGPWWRRWLTG